MSFESKIWLIALLAAVPAFAALFFYAEKRTKKRMAAFAASKLLEDLAASVSPLKKNIKIVFTLCGIGLILLALARPQWGYDWQETKGKGIDILIALDTSKSMLAEDIKPNRLERAKLAILDFLEKVEGDRMGLIAFSGSAFLQCPLTLDYDAFRQTLESVDTHIISRGGTDIAAAIDEAQSSFSEKNNFKILVLITDGEDLESSGIEMARIAAKNGMKIYTVGVGSVSGELIPIRLEDGSLDFVRDSAGNPVKTRLDEATLTEIASVTDGFYTPLGNTGQGLEQVYEVGLQTVPKQEREARLQKVPREQFQWPLGLAVLLLILESLIGTRRRKVEHRPIPTRWVALLILCLFLASAIRSYASPQSAEKLYQSGDFNQAEEQYGAAAEKSPEDERLKYNLGASKYRVGKYEEAEETLTQATETDDLALQKNAYYNLGNTRYRKGQAVLEEDPEKTIEIWEQALVDYENALNIDEKDEDARFNYEFVKRKLEELKQQQQQQNDQQNQDQQEDQEQNQDQQQQDQQQDQQQNQDQQNEQNQDQEQQNDQQQDQQNQDQQQQDQQQQDQEQQNDQQEGEGQQDNEQQNQEDQQQDQQQQQGQDQQENQEQQEDQKQNEQQNQDQQKEEQDQQKQEQQQQEGDQKDKEQPQQQEAQPQGVPGRMTREEAQQLLDAMKDDEKKLPVGILREGEAGQETEIKDW